MEENPAGPGFERNSSSRTHMPTALDNGLGLDMVFGQPFVSSMRLRPDLGFSGSIQMG